MNSAVLLLLLFFSCFHYSSVVLIVLWVFTCINWCFLQATWSASLKQTNFFNLITYLHDTCLHDLLSPETRSVPSLLACQRGAKSSVLPFILQLPPSLLASNCLDFAVLLTCLILFYYLLYLLFILFYCWKLPCAAHLRLGKERYKS